jgi:hypothetical protein
MGEKISAVEGLRLSKRMSALLTEADAKRMSGDETRSLIARHAGLKK